MKHYFFLLLLTIFLTNLSAYTDNSLLNYSKFSKEKDDEIVAKFQELTPWGMNVSIDLYSADSEMIRNGKMITKFIKDLVKYINMRAYGEPIVVNFGETPRVAGYSAMQLIETSSITAHFVNSTNSIHIDIFSCKHFRPCQTALWCKTYFKAQALKESPGVFRY